jgi:hypothetical protein
MKEKLGRAMHQRNVLAPVAISAMHRSGLLGNVSIEQVQVLRDMTCVDSVLGCSNTMR